MATKKFSEFNAGGTGLSPSDTAVGLDVSQTTSAQNSFWTWDNVLSVITRGITDKVLRWQRQSLTPNVSGSTEAALYFDGSNLNASYDGQGFFPVSLADRVVVGTGNATTDTANITAAYNSLLTTGGRVRLRGDFTSNSIVFSAPSSKDITLDIDGLITMNGTWQVPAKMHLQGVGRATGTSRYYSNVGRFYGATTPDTPILYFFNQNGPNLVRELTFSNNSANAAAIKIRGGSSKIFEKIGIDMNATGCEGVYVETSFWIYFRDLGIVSSPNKGYCLHFAEQGNGGYIGLIRVENAQLWQKGILIDGSDIHGGGSPTGGNFLFEDIVLENPESPVVSINANNYAYLGNVVINNAGFADVPSDLGIPFCNITTNYRPGTVTSVQILNFDAANQPVLLADADIPGLEIYSPITTFGLAGNATSLGLNQKRYIQKAWGRLDAAWDGNGMSCGPSVVPYQSVNVSQDPATWGLTNGVRTTGQIAPDGSTTAAKIVEASGTGGNFANVQFYSQARTVSVGDWFIFGVWMSPASNTTSVYKNFVRLDLGGSGPTGFALLDNTTQHICNNNILATSLKGGSWVSWVLPTKCTGFELGGTSATVQVTIDALIQNGSPAYLWSPFLLHIPASAGYSDGEALRLGRYMANIVSGCPTGAVAMYPHQPLMIGNDTALTRGAAGRFDITNGAGSLRDLQARGVVNQSKAGDPTTSDIPAGEFMVYKNTSSGAVKLWTNDGGAMKSVALT